MARHTYTEEEINFIKKYSSEVSRKELADMFNKEFGTNQTPSAIWSYCKDHHIPGRDRKLHPYGLGVDVKPNNPTKYKIGDETVLIGEVMIVMKPPTPGLTMLQRCEYKKRILWRDTYGEIPDKYCIVFLDGNKRNCVLENLACIPLLWMRIMTKNNWWSTDPERTKAALKWCELHYALSEKDEFDNGRYKTKDGKRYR